VTADQLESLVLRKPPAIEWQGDC